MKIIRFHWKLSHCGIVLLTISLLLIPLGLTLGQSGQPAVPNLAGFPDPSGVVRTFSENGNLDLKGPFSQSLGTNGRSCATCHQPGDGMSLSAAHAQARFDASPGLEPLFRTNDGSNCNHDVDLSTLAGRAAAFSLMRTRGLIRVTVQVPVVRDFDVTNVYNPYGCNESDVISIYRRPLPSTNLKFLSTLMWDGRESSLQTGTTPITSGNYPQSLLTDLLHQSVSATTGHAQGALPGPTSAQQQGIVGFEMGLFTAQAEDHGAGTLNAQGAQGVPKPLAQQAFFIGVNDPVGLDPTNPVAFQFNTKIFDLFDEWKEAASPRRQSIHRGQMLFNSRTFTISHVGGLNENTFANGVTPPASVVSTCGICHDTPNVGNHSVAAPLDIGVADPPGGGNSLDTSYLPVVTICQRPSLTTCVQTTDPGRALITGKFADVARFKGPILRGLAARAPYFHNGSAQTLLDIVNFYNVRFQIGFTAQEKADLVAFLGAL